MTVNFKKKLHFICVFKKKTFSLFRNQTYKLCHKKLFLLILLSIRMLFLHLIKRLVFMRVLLLRFISWLNLFALRVILFVILELYSMARYISSVSVTLSPKTVQEINSMKSFVVSLDYNSGSTVLHAVDFVSKSPLIKGFLSNYYIVNLTFKYSGL